MNIARQISCCAPLLVCFSAAYAGSAAPISHCVGLVQGPIDFTQGYAATAEIIDSAGATLWRVRIPTPGLRQVQALHVLRGSLNATGDRVALVMSDAQDRVLIAGRNFPPRSWQPDVLIDGMPIWDASWETDGSLQIQYRGHASNAIEFYKSADWSTAARPARQFETQFGFACTRWASPQGGVRPLCASESHVSSGETPLLSYAYDSTGWQPTAPAAIGPNTLSAAHPTWLVSLRPKLQLSVLKISGNELRLRTQTDTGSADDTLQGGEALDASSKGSTFFIRTHRVVPGANPSFRASVTEFKADDRMASMSHIVDLSANGFAVFVEDRTPGSTDLLTFAKLPVPTAPADGAPQFISLGKDLSGMTRARRTSRDTLELMGAFGFAEIGYTIRSPWAVTLDPIVYRPKTHPTDAQRRMLDWKCS